MNRPLENPAIASAAPRFVLIDLFRFICAAWVIWIHVPQSDYFLPSVSSTRFRMAFFTLLAVFFQLYTFDRREHPFLQYFVTRFRRVYLPFLAWVVIYVPVRLLFKTVVTHDPFPMLSPLLLIFGYLHLWFLPFVFLVGLAIYPLAQFAVHHQRWWGYFIIGGAVLAIAGALFIRPIAQRLLPDHTYVIELLPCVPLGFSCYFMWCRTRALALPRGLIAAVALIFFAAMVAIQLHSAPLPITECLAALGLLVAALQPLKVPLTGWLGRLGRYAFGMYVVHFLFIGMCIFLRTSVLSLKPSWWYDLVTFALCVPASLFATMALAHFRVTAWLVPTGEKHLQEKKARRPSPLVELQRV